MHLFWYFANKENVFQYLYEVEGLKVKKANKLFIKTVSGRSSFLDFLLFKQKNAPIEGDKNNNLIMAIEETKTTDDESRNTGVYQRGSKFVYIKYYHPDVKLYMLYNVPKGIDENKEPSDTSIFGTNILLTLNVKIIGKDINKWFKPFKTLDELIEFKSNMRKPPAGNVPIDITKYDSHIEVSGRLAKPKDAGNIGHDPNIGALSMISNCIRVLGWEKDIIITKHGVSQDYVSRNINNKFIYICDMLNLKLDNIEMPKTVTTPKKYWYYEKSSEKIASILLHVASVYNGLYSVYENHAGCERGYFINKNSNLITLPKKDSSGNNLFLPDVILYDKNDNIILLVEGKKFSTLEDGLKEIESYDSIENEFIKPNFKNASILRCLSIFGGTENHHLNDKVLLYVNHQGEIFLNPNAPNCIVDSFNILNS